MRIAFISRDFEHASSRVRALQFVDPLRDLGHQVETLTWQPTRSFEVAASTARLVRVARRNDVVVLVKPRLHPVSLTVLQRVRRNIVVDVDDAVWTWPAPFPDRFAEGASRAVVITAGNAHLQERLARDYPAARVDLVPTAVDTAQYPVDDGPTHDGPTHDGPAVVGWIGGPASLDDFSEPVVSALRTLVAEGVVTLRVVCSEPLDPALVPSTFERWSATTEVAALQRFDIGIMPLGDDERSRGRCGLKALQYMAVGRPVVASPVGAAPDIVATGHTGLLATDQQEWTAALRALAADPARRQAMGTAARRRVEDHFSIEVTTPKLLAALEAAAAL